MKRVLIIIPAYNEEGNIIDTCKSIDNYNKKNDCYLDYIVINDGSIDNTEKCLIDNSIPHIKLIHNLGIGGAVQTGYKYAYENGYDIAVQFDGDGQHDINYIDNILKPIITNKSDLVIGSRFIKKIDNNFESSFMRRMGISLISKVIFFKTKKKILDTTSGFRACNKDVIKLFSDDYPFEYPEPISTVDLLLHNYRVEEVSVKMKKRKMGKSSISSWKNFYYMFNVLLSIIVLEREK